MSSFGFGKQFAAPDYQTRAQAGLPVDPAMDDDAVSAQAAQALSAPASQRQAQGLPDIPVSPFEALLSWAAHGGSPDEAAQRVRATKLSNISDRIALQQAQSAMGSISRLPQEQQLAIFLNRGEAGKALADRMATHLVDGGKSLVNGGPGGSTYTAPLMGFDPVSGRGYTQTPGAITPTGPSLGGGYKADGGLIISDRTGPTGQTYSAPQIVPLGSRGVPFSTTLSGGPAAEPQDAAPSDGQGSPAASPATPLAAPRGIRNNNFGNVKALPNGQAWAGQTGVDNEGHAVFANPADGVRAAKTNLESYGKEGVNTVAGIAQRWAGQKASPQTLANYTHFLAGAAGVDPNQPLDLSDPKVQAPILKGIFSFENGPVAMNAWRGPTPAASKPAATAASGASGSSKPFAEASPTQIVPPGDPAYAGVAPGTKLQRSPTGEISTFAKPNETDQKTVQGYMDTAKQLEDLANLGNRFHAMNAKTATGPLYDSHEVEIPLLHAEIPLNPLAPAMRMGHTDVRAMQNLTNQLALAQRTPGMRITQMEFQKFLGSAPSVDNPGPQNDKIIQGYQELASQKRAYANFMSDWVAEHGSLAGADQAWGAHQKASQGQSGSPGARVRTYNPATGSLE